MINNELNQEKTLESLVTDHLDSQCYISNIDTYELLFVNKKLKDLLGFENDSYQGHKCYEILQNKTAPCSFCTNSYLKHKEYYVWEHYNEYLNRYYELKDTLILYNNQKLRLEIASDITAQKEKYSNLKSQISAEQTLVKCASTLCNTHDISLAINEILCVVGKFYDADRAYLFEFDDTDQYITNTYEWCKKGIEPQIEALQKVPIALISSWIEKFVTVGEFSIDSLADDLDVESAEYKILEMQGIESLVASPLMHDNQVVGFIGLDNPAINKDNTSMLRTIAMFILDDLLKMNTAKQLEFLSNKDQITGLYNRHYYDKILKNIKQSQTENIGIVYIDINGLKIINDRYGHAFGDTYIITCSQTIKAFFGDMVFRIGGDEFVVFLMDISYNEFEEKKLQFEQSLNDNAKISVAVGFSWCSNIDDIDGHIKCADMNMLKDKKGYGANIDAHTNNMQKSAYELLCDEISNNKFDIVLQPKLYLDTKKLAGAEALVRKKDDNGSYMNPILFIPHYESQGVVHLMDLYVLRKVCELLSGVKANDINYIPHISINFSRVTLLADNIHMKCQQICDEFNVDPAMIIIEITEDCGFVESDIIVKAAEKFQRMGFKLSLDDFGCKYSNIEIISKISFDEVKFDKSLLQKTDLNTSKQIILEHLIKMYQSFSNINIVIEGIENQSQLDLLASNRNLIGQGYLFSKPLSVDEFWKHYINIQE